MSIIFSADSILFAACFDANGGLFETLLGPEDAVISDELNHASIIDGIRLCKAERHRYPNGDMAALEEASKQWPADIRFEVLVNPSETINRSIAGVIREVGLAPTKAKTATEPGRKRGVRKCLSMDSPVPQGGCRHSLTRFGRVAPRSCQSGLCSRGRSRL